MKKAFDKKKIAKSVGILAVGAVLTAGGLFLWQNQFNVSLFSSAANKNIQAVIVMGETTGKTNAETTSDLLPLYASAVESLVNSRQANTVETIGRAEKGLIVSSLRDMAVLGYNDVTKPITNHVYFLVTTGRAVTINGITDKDSISTVSGQMTQELTSLVDVLSARPGVFPKGFTVFLATMPDPLDSTGNASLCKGTIPNNGDAYVDGVITAVNDSIKAIATVYPQYIKIVDGAKAFSGHGLASDTPWFSDCLTLNETGEAELANEFIKVVDSVSN